MLPLIYLIFLLSVFFWLPVGIISGHGFWNLPLFVLLSGWQVPVMVMLFRNMRGRIGLTRSAQLYLLFNLYLLARGGAMITRSQR